MTKKTKSGDAPHGATTRERIKREIAVLKAIGPTPQRFLAPRLERTLRVRVGPDRQQTPALAVSDVGAVRSLATHVRGEMQPHLDNARRALLFELRQLTPYSPPERVGEAVQLLEALRCFEPHTQQLEEAAETLGKLVHDGNAHGHGGAGGTIRR